MKFSLENREQVGADLDRHSCNMESVGEQNAFAEHSLVTRIEFDLGNGECMSQMQATIHIWVWEVAKPFGKLLLDFFLGQAFDFIDRGSIYLKDVLCLPPALILLLERYQVVSLARLGQLYGVGCAGDINRHCARKYCCRFEYNTRT